MSDYLSYLLRVIMHQHPHNACGLYPSPTKGVDPSCAPPLPCQLNNGIFQNSLLNVWDCFLSNSSPSTSTVAGHINTVCRSVKQFVSALSLHAWGKLTAKSNTLFAECDSSHPENLRGGAGFAFTLPFLPLPKLVPICLSGCAGWSDSRWRSHFLSLMIDCYLRPPVC